MGGAYKTILRVECCDFTKEIAVFETRRTQFSVAQETEMNKNSTNLPLYFSRFLRSSSISSIDNLASSFFCLAVSLIVIFPGFFILFPVSCSSFSDLTSSLTSSLASSVSSEESSFYRFPS